MILAWQDFKPGPWTDSIDVGSFIRLNRSPYNGDDSFLQNPTDKNPKTFGAL